MKTVTGQGIPGDAVNVGLIGASSDIFCAMNAAGWYPADALTFKSSLEIVGSVLLDHPYRDAPVSKLFLMGRPEDMSFEKPAGRSADSRHHVRLWKVLEIGSERRPVWLGSATFDEGVGISRYTGAITHRIAPDIDAERSLLAGDLSAAHMVTARYQITGIGPTLMAWNGEGDRYYTDGEVWMMRLSPDCQKTTRPPAILASSPAYEGSRAVNRTTRLSLKRFEHIDILDNVL